MLLIDPQRRLVVGEREWTVLADSGELSEPPSIADSEPYLETCRSLGDRFDCDMWALYRALRRL